MTLELRKYIPEIGKRVQLASLYDYTHHLPTLGYWAQLTVRAIDGEQVKVEHYNAGDTGEFFTVPLAAIGKPIGWEPRYTITVTTQEKVDTVLSWFSRGIAVWQSHNLNPHYMPKSFTPLDKLESPGWQFPERTDAIQPADCDKLIRVVRLDEQEINFIPLQNCARCHGTGRRNISTVAEARGIPVEQLRDDLSKRTDQFYANYDPESGLFDCTCRSGGFVAMGRSKRAVLIKEWQADGWTTEYHNHGEHSYWERHKETIVHDWQ